MSKDFEFTLKNKEEIMKAFELLPIELQGKILGNVLAKAAQKNVVQPLRNTLNYSSAQEKNIKVFRDSNNKLMVTAGLGRGGYKLNWADRGTEERTTKKGANRGKIEGNNQIQPSLQNSVEPTIDFISEESGNEINKIFKRYLKKLTKK